MPRTKIDYGIDLGTTNSAIARNDSGDIRIIKSDVGQSDTTSSCVYFDKKPRTIVGPNALQARVKEAEDSFALFMKGNRVLREISFNSYVEFKRTMGTDNHFESSNMGRKFSSEDLSAEVLKKLKSYVRDDDEIQSVVITVPAMFQQPQIDATQRAAELAGFQYCELLQEPIAASIAYGLSTDKMNGYWLVFDFGGGTFDAALMKVVEGIIKVIDTSGDNNLGGKNIDYAIVDQILVPCLADEYCLEQTLSDERGRVLLREALKPVAEEIKIALAAKEHYTAYKEDLGADETGEEIIIDKTVTIDEFEPVAAPAIQRAVDICQELLRRNNLTGKSLETIVLVGGPTFLQTMRRMLREQITSNIDVSIDPMTAVAKGAALFASTRDIPTNLQIRDKAKVQITLKYPETTVEVEEKLGIKIDRSLTEGEVPKQLFTEVARNDKGWSSGRIELEGDAEIIDIHLLPGKSNGFSISLFDNKGTFIPCEPSNFTIIQGMKVASATQPYHLCVEAVHSLTGKQCIVPIPGLEKNKTLPSKGKEVFKTQKEIRPGNKDDALHIPLLNAQVPYSRAFPDERAGTFVITGEHLPQLLPKDSDVELSIEVDASRRISCKAFFPHLDETVEHVFESIIRQGTDADALEQEIDDAHHALSLLLDEVHVDDTSKIDKLDQQLDEINEILQNGRGDYTCKEEVLARLREIWKEIDRLQEASAWPKIERELNEALEHISMTQQRYGDDKTAAVIAQLQQQAQTIIQHQDVALAKELINNIHILDFMMVKEDIGLWISFLSGFDDNFERHDWKNRNVARMLIDEGLELIATNPSKSRLEEIVKQLFNLLPEHEQHEVGHDMDDVLKLLRK